MRRYLLPVLLVLALPGTAEAQTPRAPDASTRDAIAIGPTSATLQGIVVPNGAPTRYRFEWGTTEALGSVTPDGPAGDGGARTVASTLTDLPPVTRIFYRVVATSAYGENRGGVRSLVTQRLLTGATMSLRNPAGFGGSLRAAGVLQGIGLAGAPVALEFYFQNRWRQLGQLVQADGRGAFAFSYAPVLAPLRLRAITRTAEPVSSPVRDLRVRPRVGLTVRKGARGRRVFSGTVRPSLAGTRVSLQRRMAGGKWQRVKRAGTVRGPRTRKYTIDVPARKGAYRVVATTRVALWARGVSREHAVAGVG